MDKEIQKIPKRSLGIRPLSMGAPLPGYAAPMRQNDPSSMKRHLPPLKTIDSGAQSYPQRRDCLTPKGADPLCESPGRGVGGVHFANSGTKNINMEQELLSNTNHLCQDYKTISMKQAKAFHHFNMLNIYKKNETIPCGIFAPIYNTLKSDIHGPLTNECDQYHNKLEKIAQNCSKDVMDLLTEYWSCKKDDLREKTNNTLEKIKSNTSKLNESNRKTTNDILEAYEKLIWEEKRNLARKRKHKAGIYGKRELADPMPHGPPSKIPKVHTILPCSATMTTQSTDLSDEQDICPSNHRKRSYSNPQSLIIADRDDSVNTLVHTSDTNVTQHAGKGNNPIQTVKICEENWDSRNIYSTSTLEKVPSSLELDGDTSQAWSHAFNKTDLNQQTPQTLSPKHKSINDSQTNELSIRPTQSSENGDPGEALTVQELDVNCTPDKQKEGNHAENSASCNSTRNTYSPDRGSDLSATTSLINLTEIKAMVQKMLNKGPL